VSNLVIELALRLGKAGVAALLALLVFVLATGPGGADGSAELALLAWLSGAAFVLLVESSPI
jgi:hypothetical protein